MIAILFVSLFEFIFMLIHMYKYDLFNIILQQINILLLISAKLFSEFCFVIAKWLYASENALAPDVNGLKKEQHWH